MSQILGLGLCFLNILKKMVNFHLAHASQPHRSLFFAQFNYDITYRPGSRNVKSDGLPHQFSASESSKTYDDILPPTCIDGMVACNIIKKILEDQMMEPDPGSGSQ